MDDRDYELKQVLEGERFTPLFKVRSCSIFLKCHRFSAVACLLPVAFGGFRHRPLLFLTFSHVRPIVNAAMLSCFLEAFRSRHRPRTTVRHRCTVMLCFFNETSRMVPLLREMDATVARTVVEGVTRTAQVVVITVDWSFSRLCLCACCIVVPALLVVRYEHELSCFAVARESQPRRFTSPIPAGLNTLISTSFAPAVGLTPSPPRDESLALRDQPIFPPVHASRFGYRRLGASLM